MLFWIRRLKLTSTIWMVARYSIGLHGTKVIHTIQSQMRTHHSPLETVVELSWWMWWTIDQWQHLPAPQTDWDAQNCGCQGRTVIHRNKGSVLEHNPKQGGFDKVDFRQVMPKLMLSCAGMWRCWYRYTVDRPLLLRQQSHHPWQNRPLWWRGYRFSGVTHFPHIKCCSKQALLQIWQIKRQHCIVSCSEECVGSDISKQLIFAQHAFTYGVILRLAYTVWERKIWSRSWSGETQFL